MLINLLREVKKKSFCSLSLGLQVLTACSEHITQRVLGQESGNGVATAHTNGKLGGAADGRGGSSKTGPTHHGWRT